MYKLYTNQPFFFRGNGAFIAGSDYYAQGIFPPNPHTIYGALRTNYIEKYGSLEAFRNGEMADEIGTPEKDGKLIINSILMSVNDEIYLPLPQDCQIREKRSELIAEHLDLQKRQGFESDQSYYRFIAPKNEKSLSSSNKWIKLDDWKTLNEGQEVSVLTTDNFIVADPKIGIAGNYNTGSARKGMLYQYNRQYLKKGVSLLVDVELPKPIEHVSLGNKRTWWKMSEDPVARKKWKQFLKESQNNDEVLKEDAVRLSLLTPSLVDKEVITKDNRLRFNNEQIIQSVVDRPTDAGGWDMHRQRPKPRYPMLSAGTTFVLYKPNKEKAKWEENIKKTIYTDMNKHAGYGRILLSPIKGEVSYEND